jgi:hypothetical protein
MENITKYFISLFSAKQYTMITRIHIFGSDIEPALVGNSPTSLYDCFATDRAVQTFPPAGLIISNLKQKVSINRRILTINVVRGNSPALSYSLTTGECKVLA